MQQMIFYCRFYCMLNMFRTILCPSSGAREYYTDGRCLWYLVLQRWKIHEYKSLKRRLYKTTAAIWYNKTCREKHLTPKYISIKIQLLPNLRITFSIFAAPNTTGSDHLYNTLELLMMGIVLSETC